MAKYYYNVLPTKNRVELQKFSSLPHVQCCKYCGAPVYDEAPPWGDECLDCYSNNYCPNDPSITGLSNHINWYCDDEELDLFIQYQYVMGCDYT